MRQPRKPQAQLASEPTLQPSEVALIERFRRLNDKQKGFASRVIDLLLSNQSARSNLRAEHVLLAVWWRVKGNRPLKTIDRCKAIWENPAGPKVEIADPFTQQTVPVENADAPDDSF